MFSVCGYNLTREKKNCMKFLSINQSYKTIVLLNLLIKRKMLCKYSKLPQLRWWYSRVKNHKLLHLNFLQQSSPIITTTKKFSCQLNHLTTPKLSISYLISLNKTKEFERYIKKILSICLMMIMTNFIFVFNLKKITKKNQITWCLVIKRNILRQFCNF